MIQNAVKTVRPTRNRVIVLPLREQISNQVFFEMKQQVWRGKVISVGEDVGFVEPGDFIRFQPMKRRYDSFKWNGVELYSIEDKWIYVVERDDGVPLYVNGNRIVLLALTENWVADHGGRFLVPPVDDVYCRVRIVLAASHLKGLKTKDIVWVQKSDFWQYYRVVGAWLFISDICNLLCVEE